MWFIGVELEQETSAPPPKKNPGSAPAYYIRVDAKDFWVDFVVSREVFFLQLLLLIKKNISNPIQPGMEDEEPLGGCPPSKSFLDQFGFLENCPPTPALP